jgi:cephalosporin hydroxylase
MLSKFRTAVDIYREEGAATALRESITFLFRQLPYGDDYLFNRSTQAIRDRMYEESDLEDILDTILDHRLGYYPYQIEAMQKRTEIKQLANLVKNQSPDSLMEIGTAKGGTFYLGADI